MVKSFVGCGYRIEMKVNRVKRDRKRALRIKNENVMERVK